MFVVGLMYLYWTWISFLFGFDCVCLLFDFLFLGCLILLSLASMHITISLFLERHLFVFFQVSICLLGTCINECLLLIDLNDYFGCFLIFKYCIENLCYYLISLALRNCGFVI